LSKDFERINKIIYCIKFMYFLNRCTKISMY